MSEHSQSFDDFQLHPSLKQAISELGFKTPTPIQERAIPVVLTGCDVMGAAQTGTGKTAGYGLPAIERILSFANTSASPARHPVRVLVLTPTRELADQVNANLKDFAKYTSLRVAAVYGGVDMKPQQMELMRGVEVLTATPGRLLDHVQARTVNLSQVQIVVLDEADRMLDMGFLPDISRILNLLPKKRQSLMFSATFSADIKKLAENFLDKPTLVEVSRQNATAETVRQSVIRVSERDKTAVLTELLLNRGQNDEAMSQVIVFVNAKITCRRLTRSLVNNGIKADCIHGDKSQDERMATLNAFKSGDVGVLVATDVAARGLDIEALPYVINYDVPYVAEDYVHRIGRTGRAGSRGTAYMLVTEEESRELAAIEKLTKQTFVIETIEPEQRERRFSRRERFEKDHDHEGRMKPDVKPWKKIDYDPIFDQPYEPTGFNEADKHIEPVKTATSKKKKVPVAALFGGFGRK